VRNIVLLWERLDGRRFHNNSIGSRSSDGKYGRADEEVKDCSVLHSANLLVCQHRVALKWGQVAGEKARTGSVMLTEDCAVDIVEAISRHEPVSTGGTAETLEVVNIPLCPHHHLIGRDRLATGAARPAVPKQSDVVGAT